MTIDVFVNSRREIVRTNSENKTSEVIGTLEEEIYGGGRKEFQFIHFESEQEAEWWDNNIKQCTKCGKFKSQDEFRKNSKSHDGRAATCKLCAKKYYEHLSPVDIGDWQIRQNSIGLIAAAKRIGIDRKTLLKLDKSGEFVAIHTSRGSLRYSEDMIQQLLVKRQESMPKQPEFENPDSGKRIELTRGLYALVSPDDHEFLSQFNWMASPYQATTDKFHAQIPHKDSALTFGSTMMHQVVWILGGHPQVRNIYHVNNNGLDNRRENLTDEMPDWLLARFEKHRQAHPRQLPQRDSEQIPIENPHIGKLMTLRNGLVIALDDADYDRISRFNWNVVADRIEKKIKIHRNEGCIKVRYIAQEILDLPPATPITYLNKNPFDNRRGNIHVLATAIRKNTPELTAMGIRWQDKNYIFRFLGPDKKRRCFSSPSLEDALSFARNYSEKIRDGQFFCHKCQRFSDGENRNGVCSECFPKTTAGKAAAAQVRIEQRKFWKKELDRIYMEFRDKPCTDCKKSFPAAIMQAHHVDRTQKKFDIPRLTHRKRGYSGTTERSVELLISELRKCVVLCPNCHLEREWGANGILRQHFKKKYGKG